jgi:6-phosphofructokinase 1
MAKIKKIGIICSGGNSQAMNSAIIAICQQAEKFNYEAYLIKDGYYGVTYYKPERADLVYLDNFINRGNAVNGSARFVEFTQEKILQQAINNLRKNHLDLLVVIGGDGSYNGAARLKQLGFPVICLPGTIDNDIASTDYSIGFDTSLQQIVNCMDALKDSFGSHNGICFVEVMGRHYSDLAIRSCIANNAQYVVTADNVLTPKQFADIALKAQKKGVRGVMFVVTENIYGKNNLPSLSEIAKIVGDLTKNAMCRAIVLAHIQRGGTPVATDRFFSSLMGAEVIACLNKKIINVAIGIKQGKVVTTDITKAVNLPRKKHNMYFLQKK